MRRRASDVIPADILAAARAAGLGLPLWYAGRRAGTPKPGPSAREVVLAARRSAGLCDACYAPHPVGGPHNDPLNEEQHHA